MNTETAVTFAPFVQPGVEFDPGPHRYTYFGERVLNTTTVMREHKISADWSVVPVDILNQKRQIGLAAHQATHYLDEGDLRPETVADEVTPYLEAWRKFVAEQEFEPLLLESMLVHPVRRYAGTVDRFGIVHRLTRFAWPSVVDIKTGDPADAAADVQTAAYEQLVRALWPELYAHLVAHGHDLPWGQQEAFEEPWVRYSVQLLPTGDYRLSTYVNHRDFDRFVWALGLEASAHPSWRRAA